MTILIEMLMVVSMSQITINLAVVRQIESSGNDRAVSKAGCHGPYQFNKATWNDCVKRMNISYTWADVYNPDKAGEVAQWYLTKRIPAMLKHYGIPVTIESVLSSYNAGIGVVNKSYKKNGAGWLSKMPLETRDYIAKYKRGIN